MNVPPPISHPLFIDQLPTQLYLEVTNRCNSLCASCPLTYNKFSPYESKKHLSWESFRFIVDQAPRLERVVLHGIGEPLLNPDLPRFVAHLKGGGATVLFNTNAILLDQKHGDALVETGLDELRVSLDAVTPDLYARLRGVDQLPRVVRNLRNFVKRHGGSTRPKVSLWWVAMQANIGQLPNFVRLAADIGIKELYLQRLVYYGNGRSPNASSTMAAEQSLFAVLLEQQASIIQECESLAGELGLQFNASGATTPQESLTAGGSHPWQDCMRPWMLMYITANGTVLPCCISPFATQDFPSIMLGNVFEHPLIEIWNGAPYRALREAVLSTAPAPWPCQYCGVKWSL